MNHISRCLLLAATTLSLHAEGSGTLLIGGSGYTYTGSGLLSTQDSSSTLSLSAEGTGTLLIGGSGYTYTGAGILTFTGSGSLSTEGSSSFPGSTLLTGGAIRDISDSGDILEYILDADGSVTFDPIVDPIVIIDPTLPEPFDIALPFLSFVGVHQSADGNITLGYDLPTENWQLRSADTGKINPLPLVPYPVEEGQVGPTVMLSLLPNGLSGDGTTVIGTYPIQSSVFRYRADARDQLEVLENGLDRGYDSSWATQLSFNGDVVVGQVRKASTERWQAARWDVNGQLTVLNPLDEAHNTVACLITPDGTVIAGNVSAVGEDRSGVVPFIWSEQKGFRQLGDPDASNDAVLPTSLSDDGNTLSGFKRTENGSTSTWIWTDAAGFSEEPIYVFDSSGEPVESYTLTGVDLERGIYMGNYEDGRPFMSYDGVTIDTTEWMGSIAGPIDTLRSAMAISSQTMEGAHHRPIKSLALPGRNEFAWATGDLGKATRQRDATQSAGEFGYGCRIGTTAVFGIAVGYSDLNQTYDATGSGETNGMFAVADLGFTAGPGDLTLTALVSRSDISTTRNGSTGDTTGKAYSLRARYDKALGKIGAAPFSVFTSFTYDHSAINGYSETGGVAPASYGDQSKENCVARLGVTSTVNLAKSTDLCLTIEGAHLLTSKQGDFTGTDIATGVLDFSMPDVRTKRTWGRLGLDIDHKLSESSVISLTLHASTEGDAFDTAAALSIRKGF